jgi:lipopolysaccharide heptosyltransferase III
MLIIKLGAIGDVIRTTSILEGLMPAKIDWITSELAKPVLSLNPYINNIYIWEERGNLGEYDLVISLEDDQKACELASSIKSKKIIGSYLSDGKITYSNSAWFDMSIISKYGIEKANQLKKSNRKTYQQHMADLLGVDVGGYVFGLTPEEIQYGKKYVRALGLGAGDRVIGINTGAGKRWPLKSLSIEKTIDLIKRLRKELGVVSLILGGPDEKERNEIIAKESDMPNGGVHSLRDFAAIVNQSQLLLSSDSLALHFGIALRKKIVVFFGPTSPSEIELYGLGAKVCPDIDCLVCYKKECDKKPNCMDQLSVDDLFKAVKRELV